MVGRSPDAAWRRMVAGRRSRRQTGGAAAQGPGRVHARRRGAPPLYNRNRYCRAFVSNGCIGATARDGFGETTESYCCFALMSKTATSRLYCFYGRPMQHVKPLQPVSSHTRCSLWSDLNNGVHTMAQQLLNVDGRCAREQDSLKHLGHRLALLLPCLLALIVNMLEAACLPLTSPVRSTIRNCARCHCSAGR